MGEVEESHSHRRVPVLKTRNKKKRENKKKSTNKFHLYITNVCRVIMV